MHCAVWFGFKLGVTSHQGSQLLSNVEKNRIRWRLAKAEGRVDREVAIECYKALYELEPEARYLGGIARHYERLFDFEQSIYFAQKALELDAWEYTSICTLAVAYWRLGNQPEASKYIEKGLLLSDELRVLRMPVILDALFYMLKELFVKKLQRSDLIVDERWVTWAKKVQREYGTFK